MCFFFSLLPATFWLVIGYLVLYLSTRSGRNPRSVNRPDSRCSAGVALECHQQTPSFDTCMIVGFTVKEGTDE